MLLYAVHQFVAEWYVLDVQFFISATKQISLLIEGPDISKVDIWLLNLFWDT